MGFNVVAVYCVMLSCLCLLMRVVFLCVCVFCLMSLDAVCELLCYAVGCLMCMCCVCVFA